MIPALLAVLLAAWALIQDAVPRRASLLIASLTLALGAASLTAATGALTLATSMVLPGDLPGPGFLQVVAGLALLAAVMAVVSAPHVVTVAWAGVVVWVTWPLAQAGGLIRTVGVAALVAAVAVFGWLALVRARPGRVFISLDRAVLDRGDRITWSPADDWRPTPWLLVAAASSAVALLIPHLATVLGGAVVAVVAAFMASRQAGRPAWGLLPSVVLLVLVLLWSLRLSGPLGGWIPGLIDGPFSPRAAQLLAALVALATLPVAGLWPVHGLAVAVLLAPVVVAVSGGFAVLLIPDGLQWWQPILAPLAVLAMAHAVARRLPGQLLVAAGVFGLWTGTRAGGIGGAALLMSAWVLVVAPTTWIARLPVPRVLVRLAWLVPVAGAVGVLQGGLRTEVAYTLVAALTAATAIRVMLAGEAGAG